MVEPDARADTKTVPVRHFQNLGAIPITPIGVLLAIILRHGLGMVAMIIAGRPIFMTAIIVKTTAIRKSRGDEKKEWEN